MEISLAVDPSNFSAIPNRYIDVSETCHVGSSIYHSTLLGYTTRLLWFGLMKVSEMTYSC